MFSGGRERVCWVRQNSETIPIILLNYAIFKYSVLILSILYVILKLIFRRY